MEAKGRKMVAMGVVIALCAVAMIGAGYAAFGGAAKTYNEGNSATVQYITLTPGGATENWNAITADGETELDTYRYRPIATAEPLTYGDPNTAYYFVSGGEVINDNTSVANGYTVKQIATKDFRITNSTDAAITKINLAAKAVFAADPSNANFKYFLKVTSGSNSVYLNISDSGDDEDLTVTSIAAGSTGDIAIAICFGYVADKAVPASEIGDVVPLGTTGSTPAITNATVAPANMSNVSLAFTLTDATA